MRRSLPTACAFALAVLSGCGPREPGGKAGETLFWRVNASDVAFAACTDAPDFWADVKPTQFDENTFFIYRISDDKKTAKIMDCASRDLRTCTDHPNAIVFDVAGNELLFARDTKGPIGTQGCQMQSAQSWVVTDEGTTLKMSIQNVISLVDNPTACEQIEAQVKREGTNGSGLQGCVVTFTIGAALE